jgi:uncharacterized cupredoxin-like copper-binding protein
VLIAALSTGHKVGLLVMALIFIAFALVSSFVAPRLRPDYPGKGLSVFIVGCFVLFALMIGAVEIFGVDSEEGAAHAAELGQSKSAAHKAVIDVAETEFRIQLPADTSKTLVAGAYTFHVTNKGKQPHNLFVDGPDVEDVGTKTIEPGGTADLRVPLTTGNYKLYCAIPGHEQLGMVAKLAVG